MNRPLTLLKNTFLPILFYSIPLTSPAADIWVSKNGVVSDIVLEGEIVTGDFDKLEAIVKDAGPAIQAINLYSAGGDIREAMKIGDMLRALHLSTLAPASLNPWEAGWVESTVLPSCTGDNEEYIGVRLKPKKNENCTCDSSCVLIWLGGIDRAGSYLGIHRPRFDNDYYASLDNSEAESAYRQLMESVEAYLDKYEMPPDVIKKMMDTPSSELTRIGAGDLGGYPAYYEERLIAECGSKGDQVNYTRLKLNLREDPLTVQEREFIREYEEVSDCWGRKVTVTDRQAAFEAYFGLGYMDQWLDRVYGAR